MDTPPDRTGDYDPTAVEAELMRFFRLLAAGQPRDIAFFERCRDEFSRQRNTKAKQWCEENGQRYAEAAGSPGHAAHFAAALFAVMRRLYGGEVVWENKRPTDTKLAAARHMTPAELQEAFGIGRSHAYALRRKALRRK